MQSRDQENQTSRVTIKTQKRLVWTYKTLFFLQLVTGFGIIASSSLAFMFEQGKGGVPYYPGGYIIGVMLVFSSAMAFRVWQRVPQINISTKAKQDVLCAINCHHLTSLCMFLVSIVGLSILIMFGLCLQRQSDCSYEEDKNQHEIVATVSSVFGFIGIVTSSIGIMLIRQFGSAFGVENRRLRPPIPTVRRDTTMNTVVGNQQDTEAQRQRDSQTQQELQLFPFAALSRDTDGATNSAYVLPQLPPYSPLENTEGSTQDQSEGETMCDILLTPLTLMRSHTEGVSQLHSDVPQPPSYTDAINGRVPTVSPLGQSNKKNPSEPPPRYACNQTIKKYLVNQID